ncbi:MAG: hypothetical protein ACD_52C00311G0002 [uncultured bacterium]|nr:MAG: hypothetical protein ACD_52C00311G0002 [uncultured bacterium]
MRKISLIMFSFGIFTLIGVVVLIVLFTFFHMNFSLESLIYWLVLFISFFGLIIFKFKSGETLKSGLVLFVAASFLNILGFKGVSETVMRLSFIGLFCGIVQAVIEYAKFKDKQK